MSIGVTVTDSNQSLIKKINQVIQRKILKSAVPKASSVIDNIKTIILAAIERTPEFQSLAIYAEGELAPEFGFVNGSSIQLGLLASLNDAIEIKINLSKLFRGSLIDIQINKARLFNSPIASYNSGEHKIEWLRWLLEEGSTQIITNYHINYNLDPSDIQRSRSNMALMEPDGFWSVPSSYAGTDSNNFISRALSDSSVKRDMEIEIRRLFK